MMKQLNYQPSPEGTILKASESLNLDELKERTEFEGFQLPPLQYPKLRKVKHKLHRVGESFSTRYCLPFDHLLISPHEFTTKDDAPVDDTPRALTETVMQSIDNSINKYSRTPSIHTTQMEEDLKNETWKEKRSIPYMRENVSSEAIAVKHIYNTVLNNEQNFAKGLDDTITNSDLLNLRKKEVRYKKWHENVYLPMQKSITRTIDREHRTMREKKQQLYRDYLTLSNKKVTSYLGSQLDEYDGNSVYGDNGFGNKMKAQIRFLQDPVHSCRTRLEHEDRTVMRCETGDIPTKEQIARRRWPVQSWPLKPLGRTNPMADPNSWLRMRFSFISDTSSAGPNKVHRKRFASPNQLDSSVDLAHRQLKLTREEVASEMDIPTRRRFLQLMNKSTNMEKLITMSNPPRREPEIDTNKAWTSHYIETEARTTY